MLIDPRLGDVEDDASSPEQRSLFGMAGSLLAEISWLKLIAAWLLLIVLPALALGFAPLVTSAWVATLSQKLAELSGIGAVLLLILVAALGWMGGRPLLRAAERGFWSLQSLAAQPGYVLFREGLRHAAERLPTAASGPAYRGRVRALAAVGAGAILCACALWIAALAWPATRWIGDVAYIAAPQRLVIPALANTVVLLSAYLAAAALAWGIIDALMEQPRDLHVFDQAPSGGRRWRIAHLSDLHAVGERYGFRIESGRAGPRGNEALARAFAELDRIHARQPLDLVLITGDMTDAGRSSEWAEFLALLSGHPELAKRTLLLPGNHDVNVVDRANTARFDFPTSPGKRQRQIRTQSANAAIQGERVRVIDRAAARLGGTLAAALAPHRAAIAGFADKGTIRLSVRLERLWSDIFPMVLPPDSADGLGVILLNSNAEAHFSFTNALGLVSVEQMRALAVAARQFPGAHWIVALHHHVIEYPTLAASFSERIGTALINGSWFVRELRPFAARSVVMHGHRHVDWIGACGDMRIISAPSPIMAAPDGKPAGFYIHTLAAGPAGRFCLLPPERIAGAADAASAPEPRVTALP
jgi:3',5'-cyclic AMP phosphodiesterase CpdA